MNALERQMTVISMPVVQMNEDHIHASVIMVTVEMALNAVSLIKVPVP